MASLGRCTGAQLVLVVLNSNRIDYYSAVKRQLSITMGIPSQVGVCKLGSGCCLNIIFGVIYLVC